MALFEIRKIVTVTEEIHHDFGPAPAEPARKGAVMAVVTNPYAGTWVEDLEPAMDELSALGERLGTILIQHLGGDAAAVEGYGKGAIVGDGGEIEHGAMWHIPGGSGMRIALGKGQSIVPSTKKVGGIGARIDIPLTHLEWSYVGSHYDAIEVGVPDAPRAGEMVLILAMATSARVHARLAKGFTLEDRGNPGVPA